MPCVASSPTRRLRVACTAACASGEITPTAGTASSSCSCGKAAEVAWSFATFFVVPLIALEGLRAGDARQRSFGLAKENWRTETGGLATLRAAMFVPCLLFAGAFELLKSGQVHSRAGQALLGLVLVVGVVVGVVATVVRQVFAVSLYRTSAA